MLYLERTPEYWEVSKQVSELRRQKRTLEDDIKKLENRIKELETEAEEKRRKKLLNLKEEYLKKLWDEFLISNEDEAIFKVDWEYWELLCIYKKEDEELRVYHKDCVKVYITRSYEDALDNLKDYAHSEDNMIRERWVDAVRYDYENCSLDDYMDWLDVSDFDKEDLTNDVSQPESEVLDKLEEHSQDFWIDYDCDENYFEKDCTIDLSEKN